MRHNYSQVRPGLSGRLAKSCGRPASPCAALEPPSPRLAPALRPSGTPSPVGHIRERWVEETGRYQTDGYCAPASPLPYPLPLSYPPLPPLPTPPPLSYPSTSTPPAMAVSPLIPSACTPLPGPLPPSHPTICPSSAAGERDGARAGVSGAVGKAVGAGR